MNIFEQAFSHTVGIEGGYVNDPNDSGGATKYGITERVARMNGWGSSMQDLPLEIAHKIYREQYWDTLRLDEIATLAESVAVEMFDTSVNCGVAMAGKLLQRALNCFNRRGKDYPDIDVDGVIGPQTIFVLRRYLEKRGVDGETVLVRALNCLQGAFYIDLVERRPKDEDFIFGWFRHRVIFADVS